jgi:hypothetical protein
MAVCVVMARSTPSSGVRDEHLSILGHSRIDSAEPTAGDGVKTRSSP